MSIETIYFTEDDRANAKEAASALLTFHTPRTSELARWLEAVAGRVNLTETTERYERAAKPFADAREAEAKRQAAAS